MAVAPVLVTHSFVEDSPSFFFCSLLQSCTVGVECCQGSLSDSLGVGSNSSALAAAPGRGLAAPVPHLLLAAFQALLAAASVLSLKQL